MKTLDLRPYLLENGNVQAYAFPGGYPLFYLCADNGVLCPNCVNNERELINAAEADQDKQWLVVAADVNYEDPQLYCDHCNGRIESAYAEDDKDLPPEESPMVEHRDWCESRTEQRECDCK